MHSIVIIGYFSIYITLSLHYKEFYRQHSKEISEEAVKQMRDDKVSVLLLFCSFCLYSAVMIALSSFGD